MIRGSLAHRRSVVVVAAVLVVASCGSDDTSGGPVADPSSDGSSETLVESTEPPVESIDETTLPVVTVAVTVAASGDKPIVQIPDEIPTELVVTSLAEGSGSAAEIGDTVLVNYIGVRSEDGTEFDNSYDRGEPFPVTLGANGVIQGWEQGLIGAKTGERLQLDIPASLAYGDSARGEVIQAGDALTFVIDVVEIQKRPVITAPPQADASECPGTDGSEPKQQTFDAMQPFCIDVTKSYTAEIATNFGDLTVELDPERAPQTVNNFVTLARYQYFDDTVCHRAIPSFVVQCGDPDASGFGGPGYTIPDELPLPGEYVIGSVVMANTGQPDSGGSQFFIVTGPNGAGLPPQYALFGTVVGGLESTLPELDALGNPENNGQPPLDEISISQVTITES